MTRKKVINDKKGQVTKGDKCSKATSEEKWQVTTSEKLKVAKEKSDKSMVANVVRLNMTLHVISHS